MPDQVLVAIGCYTERMPHVAEAGKGIQIVAFDRDTGALEARHLVDGIRNPSYLALSPAGDRLYAVEELDSAADPHVLAYALDRTTGALNLLARVPSPGSAACHISVSRDSRLLFVCNFVSGDLLCYRLDAQGIPTAPAQVIGRPGDGTARVHCALEAHDGTILVCDAGNDTIAAYRIADMGLDPTPVLEIAAPAGSFPRHLALCPGNDTVLVAHELAVSLGILMLADGQAAQGGIVSGLPVDWFGKASGAAVRVHPNGRFAYMSVRGHDSIFAAAIDHQGLRLAPVGTWKSGGRTPRDFAIDPSGRWLIAAHQDSSDLVVFAIDPESGTLTDTIHRLATGTPVSVLFL